jgi:integrase
VRLRRKKRIGSRAIVAIWVADLWRIGHPVHFPGAQVMPKRGAGEGTIEQLPSGKYRASRSTGRTSDGKPGRERKTFVRKQDAQIWLRRAAEERRGEWARRPLGEWLDKWLLDRAGELEPASLKWYRDRVDRRIRPALGSVRLGILSALDVRDWMTAMAKAGASSRERHGALKTLRTALKAAIDAGQISRNVGNEGAKLPKLKARNFNVWTPEQAQAFLAAADGTDLEAYWWLALDTGMRPGELFGLHWSEIDVTRNLVHIRQSLECVKGETPRLKQPKTDAGIRMLTVTPETIARLQAHREQMRVRGFDVTDGPVFLGRRGTWLKSGGVGYRLRALAKAAGVPRPRLYDLRHTSATLLLAADVSIKLVSQRLGHTDIAITLRHYAGHIPSMHEKATAAMVGILRLPTGDPQSGERLPTCTENNVGENCCSVST